MSWRHWADFKQLVDKHFLTSCCPTSLHEVNIRYKACNITSSLTHFCSTVVLFTPCVASTWYPSGRCHCHCHCTVTIYYRFVFGIYWRIVSRTYCKMIRIIGFINWSHLFFRTINYIVPQDLWRFLTVNSIFGEDLLQFLTKEGLRKQDCPISRTHRVITAGKKKT